MAPTFSSPERNKKKKKKDRGDRVSPASENRPEGSSSDERVTRFYFYINCRIS